MVKFLPR